MGPSVSFPLPLRIAQKLPIRNSWEIISESSRIPLPIFCYSELIREVIANTLYDTTHAWVHCRRSAYHISLSEVKPLTFKWWSHVSTATKDAETDMYNICYADNTIQKIHLVEFSLLEMKVLCLPGHAIWEKLKGRNRTPFAYFYRFWLMSGDSANQGFGSRRFIYKTAGLQETVGTRRLLQKPVSLPRAQHINFGDSHLRERQWGVENSGEWKTHRKFGVKPLPKNVFGPPHLRYVPPPLFGDSLSFPLKERGADQTNPNF